MRVVRIVGAMLMLGAPAFAQDEPARKAAVETAARVPLEKAMKGAPYSAETIVEGTQSLADGNRINKKTTGRVYRDGEGRTRREDDRPDGSVGVSITDPVAGFSYSLDAKTKTAWKTPAGVVTGVFGKFEATQVEDVRRAEIERTSAEKVAAGRIAPSEAPSLMRRSREEDVKAGPIERKPYEGIPAEGRKTTTVIPAGRVGNELPITITSEEWRSPDLNILLLTKHNDPRIGESTYRLQNIIRAEPDRSLFMVPADYTVKETGIRRMLEVSKKQ